MTKGIRMALVMAGGMGVRLATAQVEPTAPVPIEIVREALAARGTAADRPEPAAFLDLPAHTSCGSFTIDAQNAMLHAVAYARGGGDERDRHAAAAARILHGWASGNEGFAGPNGWLCAAWNLGSMARAAYVLKSRQSPEYEAVRAVFERWAVATAEAYLLPVDEHRAPPGSRPQLLQAWEREHVSNRTMAGLEAVLHVARLTENRAWYRHAVERYKQWIAWREFRRPRDEAGSGTAYFVNERGENNDHFRGDAWHRTAGLASCLQIAAMVKADTGEDLFGRERGILRTSLEWYAGMMGGDGGVPIPVWDLAAEAFPESGPIRAMAMRQQAHVRADRIDTFLQYSWGFKELLYAPAGEAF